MRKRVCCPLHLLAYTSVRLLADGALELCEVVVEQAMRGGVVDTERVGRIAHRVDHGERPPADRPRFEVTPCGGGLAPVERRTHLLALGL